jgi:Antitoxin SocA-like, Panacea domain
MKLSAVTVRKSKLVAHDAGEARLRELILYVAQKCTDDSTYSSTKLNKILFFSDFSAYGKYGKPITGVEYMRIDNGPAPRIMKPVLTEMEKEDKEIVIVKRPYFGYEQHRIVPLREPDLDRFTARDIAMVDDVIKTLWGLSATDVSRISHSIAWKAAGDRQTIPYEAVFLSDDGLTDKDIYRTKELARENGWHDF